MLDQACERSGFRHRQVLDILSEIHLGRFTEPAYTEAAAAPERGREDGVLEREFTLPEFRPVSRFPGTRAVGFHLID